MKRLRKTKKAPMADESVPQEFEIGVSCRMNLQVRVCCPQRLPLRLKPEARRKISKDVEYIR